MFDMFDLRGGAIDMRSGKEGERWRGVSSGGQSVRRN